jgi:CheY-specific phosphatase CheX
MVEDRAQLRECIIEVVERILGDGAFVFVDPLEDRNRPDPKQWDAIGVSLSFSGFRRGRAALWAGAAFARVAAANMLGVDEAQVQAGTTGADALKEILNMVVGNLMTTLFGSDAVFDLAIPQIISRSELPALLQEDMAVWLEAEGLPLLLTLQLENL